MAVIKDAPAAAAVADTGPARAGAGAWWMLAVLFVLYIYSLIDRVLISILVPQIKAHLQLSDTQMSLLLGPAFAISYAVFGLPLGWLADRWSRRGVIFWGTLVFGVATACSGLAGGFMALLFARVFVGVGESSLAPAAYSLLADGFPRRLLALAISIYTMAVKVGNAIALALTGLLIAVLPAVITLPGVGELAPWQMVFILCAVPAVPLGLLVFTFREPLRQAMAPKREGGAPDPGAEKLLPFIRARFRLVAPVIAGFGLMGIASYALVAWLPTYMSRAFDWTPGQYGPALGSLNLVTAAVLVGTGAITDWLWARGRKDAYLSFFLVLLTISIPVMAVLFFVESPWVFLCLYLVVAVVITPITAYASTVLQVITPSHLRSQMMALFLFIMTVVGGSLGPMLVALLTDHVFHDEAKLGASLAIVLLTVCPITLGLLTLALKPFRKVMTEEATS